MPRAHTSGRARRLLLCDTEVPMRDSLARPRRRRPSPPRLPPRPAQDDPKASSREREARRRDAVAEIGVDVGRPPDAPRPRPRPPPPCHSQGERRPPPPPGRSGRDAVERRASRRYAAFLPERLKVDGTLVPSAADAGSSRSSSTPWTLAGRAVRSRRRTCARSASTRTTSAFADAFLSVALTDTRGIREEAPVLLFDGARVAFRPAPATSGLGAAGLHAPLPAFDPAQAAHVLVHAPAAGHGITLRGAARRFDRGVARVTVAVAELLGLVPPRDAPHRPGRIHGGVARLVVRPRVPAGLEGLPAFGRDRALRVRRASLPPGRRVPADDARAEVRRPLRRTHVPRVRALRGPRRRAPASAALPPRRIRARALLPAAPLARRARGLRCRVPRGRRGDDAPDRRIRARSFSQPPRGRRSSARASRRSTGTSTCSCASRTGRSSSARPSSLRSSRASCSARGAWTGGLSGSAPPRAFPTPPARA